jgi:hypothetical protein
MNTISIVPVSVWTPDGVKTATKFGIKYITYINGFVSANTSIINDEDHEISSQAVNATPAQTNLWTDDIEFYKVLAQNAGLTPI